jgi:DNA-binding NarL/FixJ family response regulator
VKVLLVDDHPSFLDSVHDLLTDDQNLQIVGRAHSAFEALRLAEQMKPDLVVTDLVMPVMNGLELTRRLKRLLQPPLVVVVTLFTGPYNRRNAFAAGADGFLLKQHFAERGLALVHSLFPGVWPKAGSIKTSDRRGRSDEDHPADLK